MKTAEKKTVSKGMAEKWVFFACAAFSIVAVFGIIIFILVSSIPALADIGIFNFLFGTNWNPTNENLPVSERFGILPMIVGSLCVTTGALVLGGTLGVFSALFLVYWCPSRLGKPFEQLINVFAGVPSVIFGFFGMTVLIPALRVIFGVDNGAGILPASLVLMLMILPTVASMTKNALKSVPVSYFEGALALGATKEQAVFTVTLPAARSGVISGLIMGTGRAIGETMAVIMVCGNSPSFPGGLLTNIRTLTTNVALEMSYAAAGTHKSALIATGLVLLVFILAINFSIGMIKKECGGKARKRRMSGAEHAAGALYKRKGLFSAAGKYVSMAMSAVVVVSLVGIVAYVMVRGLPNMGYVFGMGESTAAILPAFINTFTIIFVALVIAFPIGVCSAVYLREYARPGSRIVKAIRLFTDTLAGIPSIIFGLFGNILFCNLMGLRYSLLAGGLTMAVMVLPTIVRSVEESLIAIPDSLREASLACGASKLQTLVRVVLPQALAGMLTAGVLSIGRIVGESAALLFTAGSTRNFPSNWLLSPGGTFSVMVYAFATEGRTPTDANKAYAMAFVLIVMVALIYVALGLIEYYLGGERKCKKDRKSEKLKAKA